MSTKYDLNTLFQTPDRRLTPEEYEHLDDYLRPANDDISAEDVDINGAVDRIIEEINTTGSYWW